MKSKMTHIDEGTLQAYLDGELHLDERWRTERHLEDCEICRRSRGEMEARARHFAGAVALLDRAPRSREPAIGWPRRWGEKARRMVPRAAVLLLFVGAAASATVPGSPVRRWIDALGAPASTAESAARAEQQVTATPAEIARAESGVSLEAADGAIEVVLRDAHDVRVRATLVDGTRVGVYATGEAASSRFLTGAGRIEVLRPRAGELRIEVPRGATAAHVIINGRTVLRKQGAGFDLSDESPELESERIEFSVGF